MDGQFSEFHRKVEETNETLTAALQCAAFVLRRARELSPEQRRCMVSIVKDLISMEEGKSESAMYRRTMPYDRLLTRLGRPEGGVGEVAEPLETLFRVEKGEDTEPGKS
jgi:hypothetical protein